jgi:hypothetical protein
MTIEYSKFGRIWNTEIPVKHAKHVKTTIFRLTTLMYLRRLRKQTESNHGAHNKESPWSQYGVWGSGQAGIKFRHTDDTPQNIHEIWYLPSFLIMATIYMPRPVQFKLHQEITNVLICHLSVQHWKGHTLQWFASSSFSYLWDCGEILTTTLRTWREKYILFIPNANYKSLTPRSKQFNTLNFVES